MTHTPEKRIPGKLFVLVLGGILTAMTVYTFWPRPPSPKSLTSDARYGVIIEAGASRSSVHVYEWRPQEGDEPPWVQPAPSNAAERWTHSVDIGLGAFEQAPGDAGESLMPLVDYARKKVRGEGRNTRAVPLWLYATDDVRVVPEPRLGAVLEDVSAYLMSTGFSVEAVELIDEGRQASFAEGAAARAEASEGWLLGAMIQGVIELSK